MKVLIDIDLPKDVLKDWEPVAFRSAKGGESYVMDNGELETLRQDDAWKYPRLILRRRFQWPAWLKCRYLTWRPLVDLYRVAFWNDRPTFQPSQSGTRHVSELGSLGDFPSELIDLPFPGGDWRTRIEENPNWKATT